MSEPNTPRAAVMVNELIEECEARIRQEKAFVHDAPQLNALRVLLDEIATLRAEQRRYYNADGTFIDLEPDEVVRRRKAAAVVLDVARRVVQTDSPDRWRELYDAVMKLEGVA